ncbi:hypothetical protein E4T44_07655 [Aureobasidium sp. EXF-8845]|nr:hypothetical protein E4T44_07655 [Aureobasidium sp. EXF-8845]
MEEPFDYGPDLLSDRASFQALIDELYPTDSNMQLDVDFSSRGTSPPGPDTPPSSSGGGQEEVADLETGHEYQTFAQGALMTEMLAGMRGSTPNDLLGPGTNICHDLNTIESSFHDPYLGVPSSSQYPHSQTPAYIWESFPERPLQYGTIYSTSFSWNDPTAINFGPPDPAYHPSGRGFFDPTAFIPRSMMTAPHIPLPQDPADSTENGLITAQGSMPLATPQLDEMMTTYQTFSSPEAMMASTRYQINTSPSDFGELDMSGQPSVDTGIQPASSLISQQQHTMLERTLTRHVENAIVTETANLPIRNNYRSRESHNSRSPEITRRDPHHPAVQAQDHHIKEDDQVVLTEIHEHTPTRCVNWEHVGSAPSNEVNAIPEVLAPDVKIEALGDLYTCCLARFLPATMNRQLRREEILSFAKKSLGFWRADAPIQVQLTSLGLGHFTWDLHEYEPSSQDLLLQKRYKVGISGTWQRVETRSPPLAVKQVNFGHMHKLEEYVDNIIDRHLETFQQQVYYGEEDAVFQNELLRALCTLYTSLPSSDDDNKTLKSDLRHVLRLQVLTSIMDHPLTITTSSLIPTIAAMTSHNNPSSYSTWTSPFLANRQLKYYFAEMQTQQYNRTLNRLHQILRKAGDKNKLWMSSFVLMLGIASVLESCQHLLWIKADAKVSRGECSSQDAVWDARTHCAEMDDGFEFLCKLYHCKYRGKHRQKTRYEELKGKTTRVQEQIFADRIYEIVDRNGEFLRVRRAYTQGA